MNKKKLALLGLLLSLIAGPVLAFSPPKDRDDIKAWSVQDTGVYVHFTTHTNVPSLIRGSSIAVHGVLTSTMPTGGTGGSAVYVELRATDTANSSSELLIPEIHVASSTRNTFILFDPPILAPVGLSVNHTSHAIVSSVFYTYLATTSAGDFWIPRDSRGEKAHDTSLYGVPVSSVVNPGAAADTIGTETLDFITAETLVTQSSASITPILQWNGSTSTLQGEKGYWYGWTAGTGAITNYMVVEDSATTTGDATDLVPPIFYNTLKFEHAVMGAAGTKNYKWPWPVRYENGLTIERPNGDSARDRFRIYKRPRHSLR